MGTKLDSVPHMGYTSKQEVIMAKSAMIRARTEPKLKHDVERIFHTLGLSFTEAINLFFYQVKLQNGIPFDVRVPNKATLEAMREVERKTLTSKRDAAKI